MILQQAFNLLAVAEVTIASRNNDTVLVQSDLLAVGRCEAALPFPECNKAIRNTSHANCTHFCI